MKIQQNYMTSELCHMATYLNHTHKKDHYTETT